MRSRSHGGCTVESLQEVVQSWWPSDGGCRCRCTSVTPPWQSGLAEWLGQSWWPSEAVTTAVSGSDHTCMMAAASPLLEAARLHDAMAVESVERLIWVPLDWREFLSHSDTA